MSLYKYLTQERFDVLQNAKVRFAQHQSLNDPFELKPYFDALASESFLSNFFNDAWQQYGQEALKLVDAQIPNELKDDHYKQTLNQVEIENPALALLLDTHKQKMPEVREIIFKNFNENIGSLCLSESADNILMWAHYANNYKGFVIEFDNEHEYFNLKDRTIDHFGSIRKVNYSDERPNVATFTDLTPDNIFFIKSIDWAYEKEWRILRHLHTEESNNVGRDVDGQPIYLFSIPCEAVTGVIFGSRISIQDKNKILEFLENDSRYSHVKPYQTHLDEKKFKLNIDAL